MVRNAFYSFHYANDNWRASQVRNIGAVEGNKPATDNDWETVKRGGDKAIQNWIDNQMRGRSCVVVLVGAETAGRKWIKYEIMEAWNSGKGVVGICIHKLKDNAGNTSVKGRNPFDDVAVGSNKMSSIIRLINPAHNTSQGVYNHISSNLASWIEKAIEIRSKY
mgnify:CR=1 FL=1